MNSPKLKITIDSTGDGYRASVEEIGSAAFPVKLESTIKTSEKDRNSLLGGFLLLGQVYGIARGDAMAREPGEILYSRLESSGKRLYGRILPPEVRDTVARYEDIDVLIDSNDVEIPFELFHDGDSFFCLKYPMGRQVRSNMALKQKAKVDAKKLRAAVLYNSTKDLDGARTEGEAVINTLKQLDIVESVDSYYGEEVTKARFEEVLTGGYDIIHFAGHVDYDDKNPKKSCFRLWDARLTGEEVRTLLKGNPLIFVNACTSAKSPMGLEGMAASFVYGGGESDGVIGYIGSMWPVNDDGASFLAKTFYEGLGAGKSVGESLVEGRKTVLERFGKDESSWASFVLYGDPSIKFLAEVQSQKTLTVPNINLPSHEQVHGWTRIGTVSGVLLFTGSVLAIFLGAGFTMGSIAINLGAMGLLVSIISSVGFVVSKIVKIFKRK